MSFSLPPLPYAKSALSPHLSEETLEYHYGKHHQTYVTNLNKLTEGTALQKSSLEDLIKNQTGAIFNNAAQVYNHTFYWHSLSPQGGLDAKGPILDLIKKHYQSFGEFKEKFSALALGVFGSGWAWVVLDHEGKLSIEQTSNADCPIRLNKTPILTCDVWEHAYYIDYRNARAKYIDAWWNMVNWDFANQNLR